MEHLVIKPTLACTARCPTCSRRRQLHHNLRTATTLSLGQWQRILSDARDLGAYRLTISGGEPTLYPQLVELIRFANRQGWLIHLNSNGSFRGNGYLESLLDAGLDVLDISLYSAIPQLHDKMRHCPGLWRKATRSVSQAAQLRLRYPGFKIITQAILSRENITDFVRLLQLHHDLGANGMLVSYLEGAFAGDMLPTPAQLAAFRRETLPAAIAHCEVIDRLVRAEAKTALARLYDLSESDLQLRAKGIYRSPDTACDIPSEQALVLANGDVHPCNVVEYAHQPVVGNLHQGTLREIWLGAAWQSFRKSGHPRCPQCPMGQHTYIPLRATTPLRALIRRGLHRAGLGRFEEALHPHLHRIHLLRKRFAARR